MDKLQVQQQETKSDLLPTEALGPDPSELPPGKCEWIMTSGASEGKHCPAKSFEGKQYCDKHNLAMIAKLAKEGKKLPHTNEVNVMMRCSDRVPIIDVGAGNLQPNPNPDPDLLSKIEAIVNPKPVPVAGQGFVHPQLQQMIRSQAVAESDRQLHVSQNVLIEDLISILKDFSRAMANLTDIVKKS
jgi:hypothetical protein